MMKIKLSFWQIWLILLVIINVENAKAQLNISQQLIGTTGNNSSNGGILLSYSCGEMATTTFFSNSRYLTQGFQQPASNGLIVLSNSLNSTCQDADNGYAEVLVKSGKGPFQFYWEPTSQSSSFIGNLKPGRYYVTVTDSRGFSVRDSVQITVDFDGPCDLHIYSGLTPNGDNHNDSWVIDGIEEFPDNEVAIFNRWGDKVWEKRGYNNSENSWNGTNGKNEKLPDGTYFYLVIVAGKKYKGWVEITH